MDFLGKVKKVLGVSEDSFKTFTSYHGKTLRIKEDPNFKIRPGSDRILVLGIR